MGDPSPLNYPFKLEMNNIKCAECKKEMEAVKNLNGDMIAFKCPVCGRYAEFIKDKKIKFIYQTEEI